MAVVLKIAERGEVHRVRLEAAPTFETLDALLQELWPSAGASGGCRLARYLDEDGDACLVTRATFGDFLQTARSPCGGACPVLRLEVCPPTPEAPRPPAATIGSKAGRGRRPRAAAGPRRLETPPALSREASSEASWLCLDGARARSPSRDGSWLCADEDALHEAEGKAPASALTSGWATPCSCPGSNDHAGDELGAPEVAYEHAGLHLAELHADDWCSSAGSLSEPEPAAEAGNGSSKNGSESGSGSCSSSGSGSSSRSSSGSSSSGSSTSSSDSDSDSGSGTDEDVGESLAAEALPAPSVDLADLFPSTAPSASPAPASAQAPAAPGDPEVLAPPEAAMEGPWPDLEAGLGGVPEAEPTLPAGAAPAELPEEPAPPAPTATGPRQRRWPAAAGTAVVQADVGKIIHMGHICDGCEACPLPGPRFTCKVCGDFDLCWTCYMHKDQLPEPHDPAHRFQQVLWSGEVVRACPGGCGHGVPWLSEHPTHCCALCADDPGQHTEACLAANAHDDELDP